MFRGNNFAIVRCTITVNQEISEQELVQRAIAWITDRLPPSWKAIPSARSDIRAKTGRSDAAIELTGPSATYTTMIVEAKRSFGPRDVDRLLGGLGRAFRTVAGGIPVLVVSPWLSALTRERLRADDLNYLDLTGNAYIRIDQPALFIETQGATRDPGARPSSKARVQGPKAGRLIRLLVDVLPPYGVSELALASGLTPGYVSRVLNTLDEEALVERIARGRVQAVDVSRLIRRWAETYDVFRSNRASTYLAPRGAADLISRMARANERTAITGSFAAVRDAPISAPALLAVYVLDVSRFAAAFDLIPATDEGGNVTLLSPFDPVVWERTLLEAGVTYVARSQAAVDCLTGNGRMPAEGAALLAWMSQHEGAWRSSRLPDEPLRAGIG